jgi:hypothetical protein
VGEQVACGISYPVKDFGGCGWVNFPAGTITTLRDGPYVGFY